MSFRLPEGNSKLQPLKRSESLGPKSKTATLIATEVPMFGSPMNKLSLHQCGFGGAPIVVEECCDHICACLQSSSEFITAWTEETFQRHLRRNGCEVVKGVNGQHAIEMSVSDLKARGLSTIDAKRAYSFIQREVAKVKEVNDLLDGRAPRCAVVKRVYQLMRKYNENKQVNLYSSSTMAVSMVLLKDRKSVV